MSIKAGELQDGMPIAFELAAANVPERVNATETLARVALAGYTVIAEEGVAGEEPSSLWTISARALCALTAKKIRGATDRSAPTVKFEPVFWTCGGQFTLEHHRSRTTEGLCTRVAPRLLALAAGLIHNQQIGDPPGRHFAAYGH